MISLVDFLEASGIVVNRADYKVHLAVPSAESSPLDAFFQDDFNNWQGVQNNRNFQCEHVITLIHLDSNRWLFAGAFTVDSIEDYEDRFWYNMTLLANQEELIGRVIVHYNRTSRASYRIGRTIEAQCTLGEILPQRLNIDQYPGHNNVRVSYQELNTIITQKEATWYGALANIKGIYLITDTNNGKHYVGKADGQDGLWQRWSYYAKSGHGDNKELKALLRKKGQAYKQNFQFSILEIADFRTDDDQIDERETHWKEVIKSKDFGYNAN